LVDFGLWGGLVPEHLAELEGLHQRGVVGFKAFMSNSGIDDFHRVPDGILAIGLKTTARLNAIVGVHAESHEMVERLGAEVIAAGRTDRLAWCHARPPAAEVDAIALAGLHARRVGTCVSRRPCELREGWPQWTPPDVGAFAETCPHYLAFTEQDFARIGPALACTPIRDAGARSAVAARSRRVDLIGSDHRPARRPTRRGER
jgi:allantoinase